MEKDRRRPYTRFAVLTLVVGGHVLLVTLFSASRSAATRRVSSESHSPGTLIFVELPPPPPPLEALPAQGKSNARSASSPSPTRQLNRSNVESASGPAVETPAPIPQIDWHLEAERMARDMAPELMERERRKCQDPGPTGMIPPECRKRSYETEWKPEPRRVGVAYGLLPYVRLGKRCAIGLGFFACGVGKLPEPDGHLLDDMGDPARPRSSVPDVPGHQSLP